LERQSASPADVPIQEFQPLRIQRILCKCPSEVERTMDQFSLGQQRPGQGGIFRGRQLLIVLVIHNLPLHDERDQAKVPRSLGASNQKPHASKSQ
jgi:hypothetical protein